MMFDNKVVYQIYPKSFMDSNGDGIGDINGIISKLDYIKNLGVDYLWLSPINKSPQYDNGYDISDYYEIDEIFGTKDDYINLIKQTEMRDMKVMLDLVLNHTSSEHEWFKKAVSGDPKYMDYYIWRNEPNELKGYFSKSAWTYHPAVGKYYFHLFDKHQPDLNWENPSVRDEIYKMVNYWIDLGVKGFRLDVIDLIGKEPDKLITGKGPKFYDYLKELNNYTFKNDILTVGECWLASLDDSYKMCSDDGLTQVFHFSHLCLTNGADKWEQKPLDYDKLVEIIRLWQNDYQGSQSIVMNNHDLPRLISLWMDDKDYRYESATALCLLFGLLKGTQYIYQGEEIGMTNDNKLDINDYDDVETLNRFALFKEQTDLSNEAIMDKIKLISRDNARTPMQWDDSEYGGFSTAKPWLNMNHRFKEINVKSDLLSSNSVYNFYQTVINFKKDNYDTLIDQKIDEITYNEGYIHLQKGSLNVVVNVTNKTFEYDFDGTIVLNNYNSLASILYPY